MIQLQRMICSGDTEKVIRCIIEGLSRGQIEIVFKWKTVKLIVQHSVCLDQELQSNLIIETRIYEIN